MDEAPDENRIELENELARREAQYEDALRRSKSLTGELVAAEETIVALRLKLRAANRKRKDADHYRALLHQLRSRWYLRPFIPGRMLERPALQDEVWKFRGPHFGLAAAGGAQVRKRVLIVGHLLSARLFGSERSLLDTICAIDPARFDVFVVFPEANEAVFQELAPHVQGIAVLDYRWWREGRETPGESVADFEALLDQQTIDLVHVNTIMIRDPLLAARRLGIPSVVHAREIISRDDEFADRLNATPAMIVREVCENATHVLGNSAATLAEFDCGARGSFLYNSIEEGPLDLPNEVDPHSIRVGLISSNIRKKGVLDFFELAARAEKALPSLQFHLIGPMTVLIEEWRAGLAQVPANLHLQDYAGQPSTLYRGLNIVLNLSHVAESFGRTVAEAMMARRPVIAYRHGALPELIDDGETGFLVPYLDLAAVLDRLQFFVEHPGKIGQFGASARARAQERFSPAKFSHAINDLYERLIVAGRPAR